MTFSKRTTQNVFAALLTTLSLTPTYVHAIGGGEQTDYLPSVAIQIRDNGNGEFCSGVLISEQWMLTAAHCFENNDSERRDVEVQVYVELPDGMTLTCLSGAGTDQPVGQTGACRDDVDAVAFIHPDFGDGGLQLDDDDDVALVRLDPPTNWTIQDPAYFARIGLDPPRERDFITIDGYSYTDVENDRCELSTPNCPGLDRTRGVFRVDDVDDGDIEYDNNDIYRTCKGDSGAPVRITDGFGPVIVGLHVQGPPFREGACGDVDLTSGSQAMRINGDKLNWIRATTGLPCFVVFPERGARSFGDPPGPREVPNVVGETCADGRADLRRAGFRSVCSDLPGQPEGVVAAQSPRAGSSQDHGTRITLEVFSGTGGPDDPLPLDHPSFDNAN